MLFGEILTRAALKPGGCDAATASNNGTQPRQQSWSSPGGGRVACQTP